ncbi:hypothetical protein BS333_01295 [Vibrio azureus]|uniref:Glycosyl transferase family 1 domain-containing protein n=1 Tax=Vibrio azureus NBRC 104587 TaxID=1219077 RepID=U3APH8_9VIBR|nr:glycosyltransferase [Vibrio azureus]AUI85127.1 hypothetical protein BS333_01295 [Vibrio azureus]GAD75197.1 hypothetical protein VAZ01S_021_00080 [Vibrio azureus NBRC 104587]
MNRILINASAAREGGALTIVESYVAHHANDGSDYILLSPNVPISLPNNFYWKRVETKGIMTVLFALFFSLFYVVKYKSTKIVSFSNVNLFFTRIEKVTYFHNYLILHSSALKFFLIRMSLMIFGRVNQKYVFQSKFVYANFCKKIFKPTYYLLAWPGVTPINLAKYAYLDNFHIDKSKLKILVPIVDLGNRNKNIDLLYAAIDKLGFHNVVFFITSPEPLDINLFRENIKYVGKLDKESYNTQLIQSDAVLILSLFETVCLPIFEALSINRQAIVYEREYINSLNKEFGGIDGLITFKNVDDLCGIFSRLAKNKSVPFRADKNYFTGNWGF